MNIFWVFCVMFMSCFEIASADTGLEGMLMNSLSAAQGAAKSDASGKHVPGYSVQGAEALGRGMSKMTDSGLKHNGHQRMQDASTSGGAQGESIIMKGAARPPDQSLESHSMFVRAEEILKDPYLQMQHLTAEDCRVLTNEEQNHYTKRIIVEEKETIAREKRTCEQPANRVYPIDCVNFLEPLNSTIKFDYKMSHSFIPFRDRHGPFLGNIING